MFALHLILIILVKNNIDNHKAPKMKKIAIAIVLMSLILGILVFHYCRRNNERVATITGNNTRPIDELKSLVWLKGDTTAYNELYIAYLDEEYDEEYLVYSLYMANKYNYPPAYFFVYDCLTSIYENHPTGKIDEKTKKLALSYLKKGVELGDYNSKIAMGLLYMHGKYVPKDTVLGKKLYDEGRGK